jgi:hypothetical protein
MLLEATTLLHLSVLFFPTECYPPSSDPYPIVIIASTVLSVLWHLTNEEMPILTVLDMVFAAFWFGLDVHHATKFHNNYVLFQVIYLDIVVALIHILCELSKNQRIRYQEHFQLTFMDRDTYTIQHSIWHMLSVIKAIAVMSLLHCVSDPVGQNIGDIPDGSKYLYENGVA